MIYVASDPELIPILFGTFADFPTDVHAAIVEGLANTPGQEATDALIQTAIAAEDNDLRTAAANALKTRSLFSYVPTMMSALQSTVECSSSPPLQMANTVTVWRCTKKDRLQIR